jgi:hypothetical protein
MASANCTPTHLGGIAMRGLMAWSLAVGSTLTSAARAQEDPVIADRKLSEWVKMLREEKEPTKRYRAIIALEVAGPRGKGVLQSLFDVLADKKADVETRREIARTLGRMGPDAKGAAEALGDALKNDASDSVKEAAAKALGGAMAEKGHTQVLILAGALSAKHEGTRVAAAESLRDLGGKARAALPQLLDVLKNMNLDRFSRLYVAQLFAKLPEDIDKTSPVLIEVLHETSAHVSLREAAAESLGQLKAGAAVTALGKALHWEKDKDNAPVEVRRAAAVALLKIGSKATSVWPVIETSMKTDPDTYVRSQVIRLAGALGREESAAVPALTNACLKDGSPDNRLAAIQELGALGRVAVSAKGTLAQIMREDGRQVLRNAAAAALKKIEAP